MAHDTLTISELVLNGARDLLLFLGGFLLGGQSDNNWRLHCHPARLFGLGNELLRGLERAPDPEAQTSAPALRVVAVRADALCDRFRRPRRLQVTQSSLLPLRRLVF